MQREKNLLGAAAIVAVLSGSIVFFGCSSSPDEAQLKQLGDLKEEVAALEKNVAARQEEKGALQQVIAEKTAKLAKCNADQQVVRQRLGK